MILRSHLSNKIKINAIINTIGQIDIKNITSGSISRIVEDQSLGQNDIIVTNNLHFTYSWHTPFNYKHVKDAEFYNIDNEVQAVEMMYTSQTTFLENSKAKGFKYDFENLNFVYVLSFWICGGHEFSFHTRDIITIKKLFVKI